MSRTSEPAPELIQLVGPTGIRVDLTNHGARLMSLIVPDRTGRPTDVTLGFDSIEGYETNRGLYLGATVGRVANRTAGASFVLDGVSYSLAANDGAHHLHGGVARSFDRVIWTVGARDPDSTSVEFSHVSPHLEEGYPGNLETAVTYTLTRQGGLLIDYRASANVRTPVNLTHHTYWHLGGSDSSTTVDDHILTVLAGQYLPTDRDLIPLGPAATVGGTLLDFRQPAAVGPRIAALAGTPSAGLDHNMVLDDWDSTLRWAARLQHPGNGLVMDIHTTEPGVQVYSAGIMPPTVGKGGALYPTGGGICLEAQHFPDSLHHPEYPTLIVEPGDSYRQTTEYRFSTS